MPDIVRSIDKDKLIGLVTGIAGIYLTYITGGLLHEHLLKKEYINRFTGQQTLFKSAVSIIIMEKLITWILGSIYNHYFIPKQQSVNISTKSSLICAVTVFISAFTNNWAMILVSYPIVMMFKSCNVLSVIMIAVLCSRVTDPNLKLGPKKIIVAIFVSIGIILYKIFDPESKEGEQQKVQFIGLGVLLISLLADGFLPDFQAEMKQKYKPQPTEMMVAINKWCFILALIYLIVSLQIIDLVFFSWNCPLFIIHLVSMSFTGAFGQLFVYRMIKMFKQHMVPFVITTRKIVTVVISIVYYHHQTTVIQIIGILIVFVTVTSEFISQILKDQKSKKIQQFAGQELVEQIIPQENKERKSSDDGMMKISSQTSSQTH